MHRAAVISAAFLVGVAGPLQPQQSYPILFSPDIANAPAVQDALRYIDDHSAEQVREWIRITEIPAKSEHEERRAAYVRAELEKLGLEVVTDSIGNVIARRRGTGGGPTVVFAAHMDTVHPTDTDVTVTRRDGRLYAPGVYDNSASVANMLSAARALHAAGMRTRGDTISCSRRGTHP